MTDRMDQGVGPTSSCKARGSVLTRVPTLIAAAIEDETAMAELLLEWRALADAVQPPSIFLDPAVWQSWRRTLASNAKPLLFVVREAERMVGVLPAMIKWAWRGPTLGVRYDYDPADRRFLTDPPWRMVPLRQLSPISSLPATMLGPMLLAQPEHRREVIFTVTAAIAATKGWDVAVIPLEQPDVALWQDGFAAAKLRSVQQNIDRKSFYLSNAVSFNTVVARQNQKFRANVRRVSRAAERAGIAITISHDRPAMLSWLEQAATAHPNALPPRLKLAQYYLRSGRPDKVIPLVAKLLVLQQRSPEVLETTALAHLALQEYDDALAILQQLVVARPESANYYYLLATAASELGDVQRAKEALREVIKRDAKHVPSLVTLARIAFMVFLARSLCMSTALNGCGWRRPLRSVSSTRSGCRRSKTRSSVVR